MSARQPWVDEYESIIDDAMRKLEDLALEAGAAPLLNKVLDTSRGGGFHQMLRGRLVDAGWTVRAGVWTDPEGRSDLDRAAAQIAVTFRRAEAFRRALLADGRAA